MSAHQASPGPAGSASLDFSLPPDLARLQAEAVEVALAAATRSPFPEDSWLVGFDPAFTKELADRGWIGMTWPVEEGGHGRSPLERFVVYEALISNGAPVAAGWFADRQIGPTLLQFGTLEQRRRWLPAMVSGESIWCIGMSEPDNGSDVAGLKTKAVRDGDHWVLTGSKVWTSGAAHAQWCYAIARTDPDAPQHAGLSEFIVDMRSPGVSVSPIEDMTGNRHFCEVVFEDVVVPGDHLVGQPNASFKQVMRQMEHERGGIDRLVSNYALFRDLLADGKTFDRADPLLRQEVAAIETGYRIGRMLVLREVLGQAPPGFSAATKTFCTELEQRVSTFVARAMGAGALIWGPDQGLAGRASRSACYAPAYTIMGGTTQILRNVIGERLLGLPHEPRV